MKWRLTRLRQGYGVAGRDGLQSRSMTSDAPTYKEALAWLYGLQRFGIKLGLENSQRLLAELGLVSNGVSSARFPKHVIHVAGTNGKGSVCAMVDAMCRAQ